MPSPAECSLTTSLDAAAARSIAPAGKLASSGRKTAASHLHHPRSEIGRDNRRAAPRPTVKLARHLPAHPMGHGRTAGSTTGRRARRICWFCPVPREPPIMATARIEAFHEVAADRRTGQSARACTATDNC
jgi:hypothetical protein